MKIQQLQKILIKEVAIAALVVGVLLGAYIGVSSWTEGKTALKAAADARMNQQVSEISAMRAKLANAGKDQERFAELMQSRVQENFAFDNAQTREVLERLIKKHRISVQGKLEYSGEEKLEKPELSNTTLDFMVRRNATLKFGAITDLHVYVFVDSLLKQLPGMIDIKKLKIVLKAPLDDTSITQLSIGDTIELVEADLEFDWYAVVPKKETNPQVENAGGTP